MSAFNLCDYIYAHILVRDDISLITGLANQVAFKNCAPLPKWNTKTEETAIDDAENLKLVYVDI